VVVIKNTVPVTMVGSGLICGKKGEVWEKRNFLEKIYMQRNLENPTPGSNSQTFCLQNDYSKIPITTRLQLFTTNKYVCTLCT
jgi:hypothetical protein